MRGYKLSFHKHETPVMQSKMISLLRGQLLPSLAKVPHPWIAELYWQNLNSYNSISMGTYYIEDAIVLTLFWLAVHKGWSARRERLSITNSSCPRLGPNARIHQSPPDGSLLPHFIDAVLSISCSVQSLRPWGQPLQLETWRIRIPKRLKKDG